MDIQKPSKTLKVYKENDAFVIERVNEFDHSFKRYFITEEGLKEGVDSYHLVMDEYDLQVSEDLWAMIIKHLSNQGA